MPEGKLIIFSAPSGSGKTTLVKHLLHQNLGLQFSISATSRAPRSGEVNGRDYYFLPEKDFKERIQKGDFLEWEEVYRGTYYGTLRSEVERIWQNGHHVIFDMDVVGGLNLKKQFGDRALAIFVKPPSLQELEKRLRSRDTETEEKISERLNKAGSEINRAVEFDHILLNNELSTAAKEAESLVRLFLGK